MRPTDDIKRFIDKAAVSISPKADKAVLDGVLAAQKKATDKTSAAPRPSVRSIVMRSSITKLAAAAVVVLAVVLFIGLWDKSAPAAYAIEQTLEANRGVRFLHLRGFTAGHEEPREGWIECGEDGRVKKARASMPEWTSPVEGPMVFVWKDDTVQTWVKKKNLLTTGKDDNLREQLNAGLQEVDPRLALSRIYDLKAQGKVEVTIEEPSDTAQPVTMTVTYLAESGSPGQRKVLSIDRETKLINAMALYRLRDGQYRLEGRIEVQEYNQPIDPKMFDLANEAPADAERLDLTNMGLSQGQFSDEEAAIQVVRQFFASLQAGDYDTAGKLVPVGAAAVKQHFGAVKILRIVSVGPATPVPGPGNKVMAVPCTIECEQSGKKDSITLSGIRVQQLPNQPDRWTIQTLGD